MLEKTPLAETAFNNLYNAVVEGLLKDIANLKAKVGELESQIKWLEQDNSKHL